MVNVATLRKKNKKTRNKQIHKAKQHSTFTARLHTCNALTTVYCKVYAYLSVEEWPCLAIYLQGHLSVYKLKGRMTLHLYTVSEWQYLKSPNGRGMTYLLLNDRILRFSVWTHANSPSRAPHSTIIIKCI